MLARLIIIAVIVAAMLYAYHAIAKPPPQTEPHTLQWDWPGQPVTFLIEAKADRKPWQQIAKTTNQIFRFTNLAMSTLTQYYRVRATDGIITSDYSNIATGLVRRLWVNH